MWQCTTPPIKLFGFFLWKLKTWAFGALLQLELASSLPTHHCSGFMKSVTVVALCSGFVSNGFFSLRHLDISYEYLINQRDNGDDWPKIAHIPYIRIDSNVIAVLWIQNNFCPGTCLALMFSFLLLIGLFHC